jgi:hypothetical protein
LVVTVAGGMLGMTLAACSDSRSPTDGRAREPEALRITVDNSAGTAIAPTPRSATLEIGRGILLKAQVIDARGEAVAGAKATWRSTNSAVATVTALADSGLVSDNGRAAVSSIAAGTTLIIASYEAVADTATITVARRTDSVTTPPPPPPPAAPEFDLTVHVRGAVAIGMVGDSVLQRFDRLAGATVTLTLLPPLPNDSLPSGATPITSPTVVGTATTDAQGTVRFTKITSARYRVAVQPPAGSAWLATTMESGAPFWGNVQNDILLRKP